MPPQLTSLPIKGAEAVLTDKTPLKSCSSLVPFPSSLTTYRMVIPTSSTETFLGLSPSQFHPRQFLLPSSLTTSGLNMVSALETRALLTLLLPLTLFGTALTPELMFLTQTLPILPSLLLGIGYSMLQTRTSQESHPPPLPITAG